MSYKDEDSIKTGIQTLIDEDVRIVSQWKYKNWRTFIVYKNQAVEEYETLKNADEVIDIHQEIFKLYKKLKGER